LVERTLSPLEYYQARIWINQSPTCRIESGLIKALSAGNLTKQKKSCNHENKPIQEPRKVGRETVTWTLDVCLNQANKFDEDPFHLWAIYEEKGMD
jgi:hypothetical protein